MMEPTAMMPAGAMFNYVDQNHDGVVTRAEFYAAQGGQVQTMVQPAVTTITAPPVYINAQTQQMVAQPMVSWSAAPQTQTAIMPQQQTTIYAAPPAPTAMMPVQTQSRALALRSSCPYPAITP